MDGARLFHQDSSGPLVAQEGDGSSAYQTTSGHGSKHIQSSHVGPEEGCYNMSGSFRTDYHIDFTGSTTGTVYLSSGTAQRIIWRTRRHQAEDNATILRHGRRSVRWHNGVEAISSE